MAKGYRSQTQPKHIVSSNSSKADETILDISEVKHQAEHFLEKYKNLLIAGIGGLALVIGGYLAYKYLYIEPQNKDALEQMYQAEMLFEKDSFDLALNNPGGGFSGFKEIAENFGGTPAGNLAKYYAGMCYLNLGNFQEAKAYFEDFDGDGEVMSILKWGSLGDANANLNDFSAAISNYEKAATIRKNEFLTPVYLKKLGILKEQQGDKEGALKAFNEIKEKYSGSPDGSNIERYIIKLQ
ncbi:MAG: tetratricopeptide repeat protein [Saprospiraceae bacterium]|nr:tetratricopeptide repeat protein [Saprospiraceae bacterium]MCC6843837.1 tetratricopeptide repeat protein [Saprospiraceae bacterium]